MASQAPDEHGNRCSCCLLAEAFGCNPRAIRLAYCQAVLQKHWAVECNHGSHDEPVKSDSSSKWHAIGPIDPVKAILICNE